jgi:RHS repeat-associated protein
LGRDRAGQDRVDQDRVDQDRVDQDRVDQVRVDQTFHAIVSDLVGSPTELVAPDGTIAWRGVGRLWGRSVATAAEPGVDCPLRFPGQYFDAETGLHYNVHRYYDPDTAAYLTPDPLGLAPATNDHAYVPNPLVWLDPLGLAGCTTTVYRTQRAGGHSERVLVDADGNVTITGDNMLHVNMSGDIAHSEAFRGPESQIVAFDVPTSYVDQVRAAAIDQRRPSGMSRKQFNIFSSGRPQIDDPKVGPDLYGIPSNLFGGDAFSGLLGAVVPGSGRVVR